MKFPNCAFWTPLDLSVDPKTNYKSQQSQNISRQITCQIGVFLDPFEPYLDPFDPLRPILTHLDPFLNHFGPLFFNP